MNAITENKVEDLLASRGVPAESWLKPERDLSTLRGALLAVRDVLTSVPSEKLDMYSVEGHSGGCGCALYHSRHLSRIATTSGGSDLYLQLKSLALMSGVDPDLIKTVFAGNCDGYPVSKGRPAKVECLRRIDALLATTQP